MKTAWKYFLEKGRRELPFVEQTWQSMSDKKEKTAFLDGYTRDFFGATVTRWDELFRQYSRQLWSGY
jgi:hypothetical protein